MRNQRLLTPGVNREIGEKSGFRERDVDYPGDR